MERRRKKCVGERKLVCFHCKLYRSKRAEIQRYIKWVVVGVVVVVVMVKLVVVL